MFNIHATAFIPFSFFHLVAFARQDDSDIAIYIRKICYA